MKRTLEHFSAPTARGLRAVVGNASKRSWTSQAAEPSGNQPTAIVGDASKRRNLRNVTLGGVTHYAAILLLMLLTTASAWAEEVTLVYNVNCQTTLTPHTTTLARSGDSSKKITWNFSNGYPWAANASHGVNDEYNITFTPDKALSTANNNTMMIPGGTKFTVTVGATAYFIKSVMIGTTTATADPNVKSLTVTVPSSTPISSFTVSLIRYYTVTPANGLTVTSGTSATSGGTTYYKPGTTVTVAPTNQYHIVEGTGGTGSASATVAADKRSFSFTMPTQNVSPTATLTEVHTVTPASGLQVTSTAYFTYGSTKYYKTGTTVTVATTNQYHIVEGTGGTGSASATIANDKRSFSFTMPEQNVSPTATLTEVHTISSPNGLTVTTSPYFTDNTTKYYKKGETYTLTVDDANKVIKTFSATGASGSSVASDKRSATVTIGSSNITVSATLLTISGSCGTGLTWSMSDTDSNGTYDRLTLSGSGTLSTSPWDTDFAASISRVDVSSANIAISSNPFSALAAGVVIVVPTLAYAVSYANAAFASKLRVQFGSYLFGATNEGGTTAYKIATGDDLRNFASAVNAGNGGSEKTFRQTADINLSSGGNFTPIGFYNVSSGYQYFSGTYDGGEHTISGLTVNDNYFYAGLFGMVGEGGLVKNVRLISSTVTSSYSGAFVAALIGFARQCTIENCLIISPNVSATTSSSNNSVGAFVGRLYYSTIKNSFVISPIVSAEGSYNKGAICGYAHTMNSDNFCTLTNVYYYNSSLDAIGQKDNYPKVTNVGRARKVTPGDGIASVTPAINPTFTNLDNGFVYNNDLYYREGLELTLANNLSEKTGYHITYKASYNNGNKTFTGNTYTVNGTDGDVTLTAVYTNNTYTVQFNGNGNTNDGTMSDQSFTYDVAQNLKANTYTRAFTVTYNYNGATGGNSEASATATATFNGWAKSDSGAKVYDDKESVENLTTTNGGTVDLFAKWTDGSVTLPTPTKTGYTFGGWYADSGLNNSVGAAGATYTPSTNITLYAKWAIITYNITYELNGGSVSTANPTSYNIETPTFTLNNPSKENYHFVGWTEGDDDTILPTVTIEQGSTGNLDYTAHYKTNNFTVGEFSYQWTSGTEVKVTACNSDATLITIPATVTNEDVIYSVTAIDASAFSGCTNLLAVILYTETPPTLGSSAFKDCTALDAIYVPAGTAETYQAANGWSAYKDKIRAIDGSYGDNVYYAYNSTTKTLYIFGTGYMTEYFGELIIPWANYRTDITTVIIGHGVTSIGSMAFSDCTGLTSIEIPASVMTIGHDAFNRCTSLKSITIPASVTYIDNCAFRNCTGLTSIDIPASVTSIGRFAFENCTGLTSIEIPANVTQISSNPFSGCSSLKTISVASGNTVFDSRNNCNAIIMTKTKTLITGCKNSVIPNGVTYIDYDAFNGCTGLTSIDIPASVTTIYAKAFMGCTGLTSIEIPASVTNIGQWAFDDCTSLLSVTIYAPELSEYGYGYGAFYNNANGRKIYVFKNCVETYKEQAWKTDDDLGMGFYEDDILPIESINLKDNDDNSSLIAAANGNALGALNVTLKGRTLYKDGKWNTLCLPFNVTLSDSQLAGAVARPLTAASITGTTLNLTFGDAVTTLTAGVPYIIKWTKDEVNPTIDDPVFTGVTIDATDRSFTSGTGDTQVRFIGNYDQKTVDTEDRSILFLGTGNNLYYPSGQSATTIGACRAYFKIGEDEIQARQLTAFNLDFSGNADDSSASGIAAVPPATDADGDVRAPRWYSLDGVKLDAQPTARGIYIHNGRKVVIK